MKNIFSIFFLFLFSQCGLKSDKTLAIQPFGTWNEYDTKIVRKALSEFYHKEIIILPKVELPKSSFTNLKSPRYRADSLIRYLKRKKTDSIDIVIGLTDKDISTTKRMKNGEIKKPVHRYKDWGIFGLGFRPGSSCIVSSFRLKNTNQQKFEDRLNKICIHEIGHNLGLKHCSNKKCVMTDACESIKTVDNVNLALCKSCTSKI